jgi:hypothetical protein
MAESVKKPRAAKSKPNDEANAKSRKASTPKTTGSARPTHEQIAELARKYWAQRGYTDGHHDEDWFRAEKELGAKAS